MRRMKRGKKMRGGKGAVRTTMNNPMRVKGRGKSR